MLVLQILLSSACLLAVGLYVQLRWKYRRVARAFSHLPCPLYLPIIGSYHNYIGNMTTLNNKVNEMSIKFKGLFCIWLGAVPALVVANPSDVKIILNSSSMLNKEQSYRFAKPYLREGLLTAPVSLWKKYRRLLNPIMHPANIELYIPQFNVVSRKLISDLDNKGWEGQIDPKDIIYSNIVDALSETIFGSMGLSQKFKINLLHILEWGGSAIAIRTTNPLYCFDFVFNAIYWRKQKEAAQWISEITYELKQGITSFAKKNSWNYGNEFKSESGRSILDVMEETGTLQDSHWIEELITFAIGASDTMVSTIYFLLVSLAANQNVQHKVYSEIQEVVGSCEGDLTLRDVNSLTYLSHAITESMRLHGVFPIIGRMATKDTKLTRCTLPAGSRVFISLHAMGRNPEVFPEPHRYNPDRFINDDNQEGSSLMSHILPFSAGPRGCIGKVYALHLIKILTARIVSKYKLVTEMKMEDIEYDFKTVMFSKSPFLIHFQKRQI